MFSQAYHSVRGGGGGGGLAWGFGMPGPRSILGAYTGEGGSAGTAAVGCIYQDTSFPTSTLI